MSLKLNFIFTKQSFFLAIVSHESVNYFFTIIDYCKHLRNKDVLFRLGFEMMQYFSIINQDGRSK